MNIMLCKSLYNGCWTDDTISHISKEYQDLELFFILHKLCWFDKARKKHQKESAQRIETTEKTYSGLATDFDTFKSLHLHTLCIGHPLNVCEWRLFFPIHFSLAFFGIALNKNRQNRNNLQTLIRKCMTPLRFVQIQFYWYVQMGWCVN